MLQDTLVLCANHRLAARWRAHYAEEACAAGKSAWPSPSIYALNHWLLETWQKSSATTTAVMDPRLALWHWREIIEQDGEVPAYLQRHRTALLAQSAYSTLCQWNLSLDCVSDYPNPDIQRFYTWACHFQAEATRAGMIMPEELPRAVAELIKAQRLTLPKQFMLLGFDSLSPSVEYLRNCLSAVAEEIPERRRAAEATIRRVECQDSLDEIRQMARQANSWIRHNPKARIACVVPNLNHVRHKIEQIFSNECQTRFNISAGLCFAHLPMIQTALHILSCVDHPQLSTLNQILLCPYVVASHADRALAAICLNELTKQGENQALSLASVSETLSLLGRDIKDQTLTKRWQALSELPPASRLTNLNQHALYIEQVLLAIGWPGQRNPNSAEYQIIERWHRLLLELRLYAQALNPMPFKKALELLHMLALETIFQPKEITETNERNNEGETIQILGLLEASGAPCDHLWVMGLHDEAWPPSAKPHPFLPLDLQRRLNMPHASAEREYTLSVNIQTRLQETAADIIFSSPKHERERNLQASALIRDFPLIDHNCSDTNTQPHACAFEPIENHAAPNLSAEETLRGGSRILQEQAECPFRAFARARLNARPLEKPNIGLRKVDQGVIIHAVLEEVWRELKTQESLCSKTDEALRELVRRITKTRLSEFTYSYYLSVEMTRIEDLVMKWLNLEKTRPPFRVREQETTRYWAIGPISLRLKIDRIDELSDGSHLLIDYKTGEVPSITDWYKLDTQYTQLPLYCLQNPVEIQGAAYAKVSALEPEFKGISNSDSDSLFSNIKPIKSPLNWPSLQAQWQMRIDQLSHDFIQGKAEAKPIQPSLCQRCELNSLCRREISV